MIIYVYKDYGVTPNELIDKLKLDEKYKNKKMSFAGRLDPMACGTMMILIDEACLKQNIYIKHDKIYNFKLVIGFDTDSNDILGKTQNINLHYDFSKINTKFIENIISQFKGIQMQKFPKYSSKRIGGIPMWKLTKENKIKDLEIPKKEINIYDIKFIKKHIENVDNYIDYFISLINKLSDNQDFRQKTITENWIKIKEKYNSNKIVVLDFNVTVSSGTYIRQLAYDIGEFINIPCLALNIERLKIGNIN